MSYRAVVKPEPKNHFVRGYGVSTCIYDEAAEPQKRLRKEVDADVEELREILRHFEKHDSSHHIHLPEEKFTSATKKCRLLKGPAIDRKAYRWWLTRMGIEGHVVAALCHNIKPERGSSGPTTYHDPPTRQVKHEQSNISTIDAPGSLGLRRTNMHALSGSAARHYKLAIHDGTFAWSENFTFSAPATEVSGNNGQCVAPVDADKLHPSSLLSVPPTQSLHLVEPFRPVPLAMRELVLERAYLLSPNDNKLLLHTGQAPYPSGVLNSGRSILRHVSRRVKVNGLGTLPSQVPLAPLVSDRAMVAVEGRVSEWPVDRTVESACRTLSTLPELDRGDELADDRVEAARHSHMAGEIVEGGAVETTTQEMDDSSSSEDDADYGFSAGYKIDPNDLLHMALKHDVALDDTDKHGVTAQREDVCADEDSEHNVHMNRFAGKVSQEHDKNGHSDEVTNPGIVYSLDLLPCGYPSLQPVTGAENVEQHAQVDWDSQLSVQFTQESMDGVEGGAVTPADPTCPSHVGIAEGVHSVNICGEDDMEYPLEGSAQVWYVSGPNGEEEVMLHVNSLFT